jgi:tetratricopeptide (TPR) repeat protein
MKPSTRILPISIRILAYLLPVLILVRYAAFMNKQNDWDDKMRDAQEHYDIGMKEYKKRNLHGALVEFNKSIELNPDLPVAYSIRGDVKEQLGDSNGALADFKRTIELDPKEAIAYYGLGVLQRQKGDLDGSNADFKKAIELNPGMQILIKAKGDSMDGTSSK